MGITANTVRLTTWVRKYGTDEERQTMREAIRFRSAARQAIADMNRCGVPSGDPAMMSAQANIVDAGNAIRRICARRRSIVLGH